VLHHHDRDVPGQPAHERGGPARLVGAHARGGLVEQEEVGVGGERNADLEIALLAVR